MKTLHNKDQDAAKKNVSDLVVFGLDLFKLLSKASSQNEGWMKSTKAMYINEVGCVVQVTTQQLNETGMNGYKNQTEDDIVAGNFPLMSNLKSDMIKQSVIAEAVTFVPGVMIKETLDDNGVATARHLVPISYKM